MKEVDIEDIDAQDPDYAPGANGGSDAGGRVGADGRLGADGKGMPELYEELSDADREFTEDESKPSKVKMYIGSMLSGNILSRAEVKKLYPYLLFISFLMLLYISNVFRMQQMYRTESNLKREIKELRAKSVTISSIRMNATRQSEIIKELQYRGVELNESLTPHKVIE